MEIDDDVLGKNAISSIWICALFSNLISSRKLFKEDYKSGILFSTI